MHIATNGPIVMTERVDRFIGRDRIVSLPVMGIFEVHDAVISAWRDYSDLRQFTAQVQDEQPGNGSPRSSGPADVLQKRAREASEQRACRTSTNAGSAA